ncbi:kinase-like domain-containing protein [Lipomyces arxii]|uniref:kinase-like domain-containing protein n=1 Tax=Lipomyces arxii TaxID=56418 RepID=UPI0034CE0C39
MATMFAFDEPEINGDRVTRVRTMSTSSIGSLDEAWILPTQNGSGFSDVANMDAVRTPANEINTIVKDNEEPDTVGILGSRLKNMQFKDEQTLGTSYKVDIDSDYISNSDAEFASKLRPSDFEYIKVLGRGSYGKVLLVREKSTGRLYAQKQLKKASISIYKKTVEQTKSERAVLESLRHPFIVKLFYALQDQHKLYLILEYAQGGELFSHLAMEKLLSESVASFYAAELVLALAHLHNNVGVVYRDLKPENCLLDARGHLVLTDFGLSKVADDSGTFKTFLGTPEYMAPEVLLGLPYDFAVDWWSLGALTYDLLTGAPPFTGNNYKKVIEKIQKTKLALPYYLSAEAKDLVGRLLTKDPKERLGSNMPNDLATIKNHRFFRNINWEKLERSDSSIVPPIVPIITDPILAENFADEFTSMAISPADGFAIPGFHVTNADNALFENFTFTASNSFIEEAMANRS